MCAFALSAACGRHGEQASQGGRPPAEVTVVTATPRDLPVTWEYIAQVQSSRQVNIQARVNGFLDRRVYTEGAMVKEGDVLFRMDPKPFQAQLDAALAALKQQEARLEVARKNLDRTKPLTAAHALSQKDLDDATGSFLSAQAAVEQAKAAVETARLNLSYTTIVSPVAGITGSAQQQDGTYLNVLTNSQLTSVAVLSPMWVNFSISENELLRYREQVTRGLLRFPPDNMFDVTVILADGSVYPQQGRIDFTNPAFSSETGTFLVRAVFANPAGTLKPGQFVRAKVSGAVRPNAILVPQRAVLQGAKSHFVWVLDKDSKPHQRVIDVGDWHGDDWFVNEGLKTGERVVVDGAIRVSSDAQIKVVSAPPGNAAPATPAAPASAPAASAAAASAPQSTALAQVQSGGSGGSGIRRPSP